MTPLRAEPFGEPLAARLVAAPREGLSLFWLGQAGFALRHGGRLALIDPYLSDSLAEKYRGTRFPHERMMAPPVPVEALPAVDLVLATHHHTDHMDARTLAPIAERFPACRFVVPRAALGEARLRTGAAPERLIGMDAGETAEPLPGWRVTAVRAAHETLERTPEGFHRFLGYCVEAGGRRVYHAGDTIPFDGLAAEAAALGPDVALLPVNGRRPELAAAGIAGNCDVEEAIALAEAAGAAAAIFHHYGMFAFNTADPAAVDAAIRAAARGSCTAALHRARQAVEYRIPPT